MLKDIANRTKLPRGRDVASVQDWIGNKITVKMFKIVNACGGKMVVDDAKDQIRIVFPSIRVSMTDPRQVLGLILEREVWWKLVIFKTNRDDPSKLVLVKVLLDVGKENPNNLATTLYRNVQATDSESNSLEEIAACIRLAIKLSSLK